MNNQPWELIRKRNNQIFARRGEDMLSVVVFGEDVIVNVVEDYKQKLQDFKNEGNGGDLDEFMDYLDSKDLLTSL